MIALILIIIFSGVFYVQSKLNLIQRDTASGASTDINSIEEITDENDDDILTEDDMQGLEQIESAPSIPADEVREDSDVINVLLLGTDERSDGFSDNARSDSMILASLNKKNKTIKLVSLERGMGVPVLEGSYEGQYDWLTHIFRYGGANLVLKTVEECFKIDVDHYVRVNFNTFIQGIDAIGGVDINLTQEEVDYMNSNRRVWNGEAMVVTVGTNHVDGVTALAYARIRKIDSDWRRVERQRKVIFSAINEVKKSNLIELNNLSDQVLPLVKTNMTNSEILELILLAPGFMDASFEQMTIPAEGTYGGMVGMGGRSLYAVDFEANTEILHKFLYENE